MPETETTAPAIAGTIAPETEVEVETAETATEPAGEVTGYTKCEQEHYEAIRQKEREVAALESTADLAKGQASAAKKQFEAADTDLRSLIRRGPELQQALPFGNDADTDATTA